MVSLFRAAGETLETVGPAVMRLFRDSGPGGLMCLFLEWSKLRLGLGSLFLFWFLGNFISFLNFSLQLLYSLFKVVDFFLLCFASLYFSLRLADNV